MSFFKTLDRVSSNVIDAGEDYLELSKKYYRLKIFQQLSSYFATISKVALFGGIFFMALLLLVIAGAVALGEYLDSFPLGCVLMAAILTVGALIIYLGRETLIDRRVLKTLAKTFFDNGNEPI